MRLKKELITTFKDSANPKKRMYEDRIIKYDRNGEKLCAIQSDHDLVSDATFEKEFEYLKVKH